MDPADYIALCNVQRESRAVLRDAIGASRPVAVLDFPRHKNAGDTLIWAGEMSHLAALGYPVGYVSDIGRINLNRLKERIGDGPVLLHGGGNFGDLWPVFQEERERIARELPNNPIVVLPQSLYFRDPGRARTTNATFVAHGNVTVLVRDDVSLASARELLPDVTSSFCHDSAFGNAPIKSETAIHDVMILRRTDQEGTDALAALTANYPTVDWGLSRSEQFQWAVNRTPGIFYRRAPESVRRTLQHSIDASYARYVDLNMRAAIRTISRARTLVTDRLHAHVLALLLGRKSFVVENSYGKIKPIHDATISRFERVSFVEDPLGLHDTILRSVAGNPGQRRLPVERRGRGASD